jgi:epoxyqueuosine reductase
MKEALRRRARELGFDDCRVTTAIAPGFASRFTQWLAQGRQGGMGYLERTAPKRVDPQQVLPGARSILTLAASYHLADRQSPIADSPAVPGEGRARPQRPASRPGGAAEMVEQENRRSETVGAKAGLIARYARYRDYHDVLGERLKRLTEFVNELGGPGARSLWYVDTGPLLERELAQRAGLGFIGKHTNLISRQLGNWIFLSEIITTLELEPDAPEKNRCGSCTQCIAACPTAAITAPFQLDARRCISYLTIELKGTIPVELRSAIGNRIFGCDDCLQVCPWNRFAREGQMMKAQGRPDLAQPDLLELLALDEAGFKSRFAGTPMLRAKRRGLLRNVCVALGNVGDEKALPALRKAATDLEPLIAEHAVWAMGRIRSKPEVPRMDAGQGENSR